MAIQTLGDLRDHGMGMHAHCTSPDSGHSAQLDLDMLIDRFGEEYVFINETRIAASCVCRRCGHRGAKLTLIANTRPQ